MSLHTRRQRTVSVIARTRLSAIIRADDTELARGAMAAAVEGGFRMVEFTLTTPRALELIAEFSQDTDLIVGAGTVMTPAIVQEAVSAGAAFIVSPICDSEVLAEAARLDVVTIPGAFTPTEMQRAHVLGADFVKVFPAPPGGVEYIHAIRAPLPHLRLFPTAGVTPDNFVEYLRAGCSGVGFVRSLFDATDLAARNFTAIRDRAASVHRRYAACRPELAAL